MGARIDSVGMRFGRLYIVDEYEREGSRVTRKCLVRCDCGIERVVDIASVRSGHTSSCGCLRLERLRKSITTHGMTRHLSYKTWNGMCRRCLVSTDPDYHRYGGRGITVCDRWAMSFQNFVSDMGPKPTRNHQIDRRDNDGNYEPENCRWVTPRENSSNKRNNVYLTANGRTETQAEWARILKVSKTSIRTKTRKGQSFQEIYDHFTKRGVIDD